MTLTFRSLEELGVTANASWCAVFLELMMTDLSRDFVVSDGPGQGCNRRTLAPSLVGSVSLSWEVHERPDRSSGEMRS